MSDLEERLQIVQDTSKSVVLLQSLAMDVGLIISSADSQIESIEQAIQQANPDLALGSRDLEKAIQYRKKVRIMEWALAGLVVACVVGGAFLLWLSIDRWT